MSDSLYIADYIFAHILLYCHFRREEQTKVFQLFFSYLFIEPCRVLYVLDVLRKYWFGFIAKHTANNHLFGCHSGADNICTISGKDGPVKSVLPLNKFG